MRNGANKPCHPTPGGRLSSFLSFLPGVAAIIGRRMGTPHCIIAFVALIFAGCGDGSGPPVHFVVPDGFRGRIDMVLDTKHGSRIVTQDGRYTFVIPASGTLRVQSLRSLQRWHTATAAYASGHVLPVVGTAGTNSMIGFFEIGSSATSGNNGAGSTESVVCFVGTASEARALGF
jgi:hypothetical protein